MSRFSDDTRFVCVVAVMLMALMSLSLAVNSSAPVVLAASPAPDATYRAPWKINTQANTVPLTDGAGQVVLVARAADGPYSGSVVVVRPDGSCVLCDIDAPGAAGISQTDGYYWITSVDRDQRTIRSWRLDERYGVGRRDVLEFVGVLPLVMNP